MTSTGLASGCPPRASFSSRSFSGVVSAIPGSSVMYLHDHVAMPLANTMVEPVSTTFGFDRLNQRKLLLRRCLLLGRRLAGGGALDRALGALLGEEFNSLFTREFIQGGGTRNRDVGDPIG